MKRSIVSQVSVLMMSLALISCGRSSELEQDSSDLFQQALNEQFGDAALANPEVQNEIRLVMEELQDAFMSALVTGYDSKSLNGRAILGCKPSIKIVAIGIGLEFTATETCKLSGTVALKLFPLTTVVDLDVVGLSFIDRIQLDVNVVLGNGTDVAVDLVFLNGNINLKLPLINGIKFNGRAKLVINSNTFAVNSRLNGFENLTGFGVAMLAKVDRAAGIREIQGCVLTGGEPSNPDGGTLKACFKLGGG